jgi:hypothetical protein
MRKKLEILTVKVGNNLAIVKALKLRKTIEVARRLRFVKMKKD